MEKRPKPSLSSLFGSADTAAYSVRCLTVSDFNFQGEV